jgi:4-carboxymuconolactone decarboxylase
MGDSKSLTIETNARETQRAAWRLDYGRRPLRRRILGPQQRETIMARDRKAKGNDVARKLFGPQGLPPASGHSKDFMELTNDYLFGEIWTRPGLAIKERSRVTCSVLAAFGREAQLKGHVRAALNIGLTPVELRETFIQVAHYAGWSTGLVAIRVLDEVIAERAAAAKAAKKAAPKKAAKKG